MNVQQFLIVVEKANRGYSAYSPDLPGCISTGKTRKEAETNMHEAIGLHVAGMIKEGLPIPAPTASAALVLQEIPPRRKGYSQSASERQASARGRTAARRPRT